MIVSRIFYLTVTKNVHYSTLSQSNRVKIIPIPPIRGLIYSRDGVILAENKSAFSLVVTPEKISSLNETIDQLKKIVLIEDSDIKRFKKSLDRKRKFEKIILRLNLDKEEVARFSVNRHRYPGVDVVARLNRHYP